MHEWQINIDLHLYFRGQYKTPLSHYLREIEIMYSGKMVMDLIVKQRRNNKS